MELKLILIIMSMLENERFNRTFMELKYRSAIQSSHQDKVLIVPLWN